MGKFTKINSKIDDLILISSGVSDYIMDIYRGKNFNFSKHYAIMPDMHNYLIYQRNIQNAKDINKIIEKIIVFYQILFWDLNY